MIRPCSGGAGRRVWGHASHFGRESQSSRSPAPEWGGACPRLPPVGGGDWHSFGRGASHMSRSRTGDRGPQARALGGLQFRWRFLKPGGNPIGAALEQVDSSSPLTPKLWSLWPQPQPHCLGLEVVAALQGEGLVAAGGGFAGCGGRRHQTPGGSPDGAEGQWVFLQSPGARQEGLRGEQSWPPSSGLEVVAAS